MAASNDEDLSSKQLQKRYEGLMTVRNKAIKGKGAWYWVHLEPILVQNQETGLAKAVKLRCALCNALFSASNPSRTASEHLKRGTCPNFSNTGPISRPVSSISGSSFPFSQSSKTSFPAMPGSSRKRAPVSQAQSMLLPAPLSYASEPNPNPNPSLGSSMMLSGGKEDLGALAMFDDTVKKLKSPGRQQLNRAQIETALNLLAEWLYESCGTVSFSCIEHPKFKSFLSQVGLPAISRRYIAGPKLDSKYEEVRMESDAKLRDALFFQLASDGWKKQNHQSGNGDYLVNVTLNLPNGTSLFRKAIFADRSVSAKYVEDTLWETITGICGNLVEKCVGIVADTDKYKSKALIDLEQRNHWMINLKCQFQGFSSLLKDFCKHLSLFRSVASDCFKLASYFNSSRSSVARTHFQKYQELENITNIRMPQEPPFSAPTNYVYVFAMMEDVFNCARPLQLTFMDDSFKLVCAEDPHAREVAEIVNELSFWNDLESVIALIKLVKSVIQEIETERPLVGQCLPLWDEFRAKIKDWCAKYSVEEGPVEEVVAKRFAKNYHPAWSAAFILDPLYLVRDNSGKYLPPFKCLTAEQEKDVDRLITRMVSREEAPIAVMELMKWRTDGLDPLYAQAVQVKQRDPVTGKMKIANPQSSRLVWETCLSEFKALGKVAVRLIFMHATSCGLKCNWSFMRWVYTHGHSRAAMEKAQKMIFIASHARLERRDFVNEEDKDAELFANGDEDVLNEVFSDPTL